MQRYLIKMESSALMWIKPPLILVWLSEAVLELDAGLTVKYLLGLNEATHTSSCWSRYIYL